MWLLTFVVAFLLGGRKIKSLISIFVVFWALFFAWSAQISVNEGTLVLTGVSSGIGRDACFYLAERGLHVIGTFRKDSDKLSLEEEAKRRKVSKFVHLVKCDVTSEKDLQHLLNETKRITKQGAFPKVIGVLNNAGISGGGAPVELDTDENLERVFRTNFFPIASIMRKFLPLIRESKGRFVTICSLKGSVVVPGSSAYCASKVAAEFIAKAVAIETYHQGVMSVIIQPGYVKAKIRQNIPESQLKEMDVLTQSDVAQKHYHGFVKYAEKLRAQRSSLSKGVEPVVVSKDIYSAFCSNLPPPVIKSGGNEVYFSEILPYLVPDVFEHAFSNWMFSYGSDNFLTKYSSKLVGI